MSSNNDSMQTHRPDEPATGLPPGTQDPTVEHSHSHAIPDDVQTGPTPLDAAVSNSDSRPTAHAEPSTDSAIHGVDDDAGLPSQPGDIQNSTAQAANAPQTGMDDGPLGNEDGLFPNGQTAGEQNLEVDVCRATCACI